MPFIQTVTNVPIPKDRMEAIKTQLGKDVSLIGKSESWLMVHFVENSPLYFKGTGDPAAIVSVDLYGKAADSAYAKFTASITTLLENELNIQANRIFVKYQPYEHWGYNGSNF